MKASKPTGKTYRIAAIADFLKVPRRRRAACLAEFPLFIEALDRAKQDNPVLVGATDPVYVWTDDGKPGLTMARLTLPDGESLVFQLVPSEGL